MNFAHKSFSETYIHIWSMLKEFPNKLAKYTATMLLSFIARIFSRSSILSDLLPHRELLRHQEQGKEFVVSEWCLSVKFGTHGPIHHHLDERKPTPPNHRDHRRASNLSTGMFALLTKFRLRLLNLLSHQSADDSMK